MSSTHLSLHYHVIFSTKDRRPLIADEWLGQLSGYGRAAWNSTNAIFGDAGIRPAPRQGARQRGREYRGQSALADSPRTMGDSQSRAEQRGFIEQNKEGSEEGAPRQG